MATDKKPIPQQLNINTGTMIGSIYSQVVGISVTDTETTLDFIYINPQIKGQGSVVARVTLPRKALERLSTLIPEVLRQHDEKRKKRASESN
jgi:hypothetical protein